MLFPHSAAAAEQWARAAYARWSSEGISPEAQRDRRAPGIMEAYAKRPPKYRLMSY
jgi:hypothetical protein